MLPVPGSTHFSEANVGAALEQARWEEAKALVLQSVVGVVGRARTAVSSRS